MFGLFSVLKNWSLWETDGIWSKANISNKIQDSKYALSMAPWCIEYISHTESEKMGEAGSSLRLSAYVSLVKQVITPLCERCPLYTWRKEHRSLWRQRNKRIQQRGLAKFPPVYWTYLILFDLLCFFTSVHSSSNLA